MLLHDLLFESRSKSLHKPNRLFKVNGPEIDFQIRVMADGLGHADLGSYGQQLMQTPHLDQLIPIGGTGAALNPLEQG